MKIKFGPFEVDDDGGEYLLILAIILTVGVCFLAYQGMKAATAFGPNPIQ